MAKRKREPEPQESCFTRFVNAFKDKKKEEGVDQVVVAEDATAIIRSNGGGIRLTLTCSADQRPNEVHPDDVIHRTGAPELLGPPFRSAFGKPYKGFQGIAEDLPEPVIKGSFCFIARDGTQGVAFPDGTVARVELWRPEIVRPLAYIPEFDEALAVHELEG